MLGILQSMMKSPAKSHHHRRSSSKRGKRRNNSCVPNSASMSGVAKMMAASRLAAFDSPQEPLPAPIVDGHRIFSRYSGRALALEDEHFEAIVESYIRIDDKYAFFEDIFVKLFIVDDPEIAEIFGLAKLSEKELRRRNAFRTHICKFLRFMTTLVDMLLKKGREDEFIHIIRIVGRQHCQVRRISFTAARWLSFKTALLNAFMKLGDPDRTTYAWTIFIGFLISEIKDAYLSHVRHLRSNSMPQVLETYSLNYKRRDSGNCPHIGEE